MGNVSSTCRKNKSDVPPDRNKYILYTGGSPMTHMLKIYGVDIHHFWSKWRLCIPELPQEGTWDLETLQKIASCCKEQKEMEMFCNWIGEAKTQLLASGDTSDNTDKPIINTTDTATPLDTTPKPSDGGTVTKSIDKPQKLMNIVDDAEDDMFTCLVQSMRSQIKRDLTVALAKDASSSPDTSTSTRADTSLQTPKTSDSAIAGIYPDLPRSSSPLTQVTPSAPFIESLEGGQGSVVTPIKEKSTTLGDDPSITGTYTPIAQKHQHHTFTVHPPAYEIQVPSPLIGPGYTQIDISNIIKGGRRQRRGKGS